MRTSRPWRIGDIADYGGELHLVLTTESPRRPSLVLESLDFGVKHRVFAHMITRPTTRHLQRAHKRIATIARGFHQWSMHIDIELKRRAA